MAGSTSIYFPNGLQLNPLNVLTIVAEKTFQYGLVLLFLLFIALYPFSQAGAVPSAASGTGTLVAISIRHHSVVVDILDRSMLRTVGGIITDNTVLLRDEKSVTLEDFHVGETVKVAWKNARQGQEILSLRFKGPALTANPVKISALRYKSQPGAGANDYGRIIGENGRHIVRGKETLLDIARQYDLGYNELVELYPKCDPWLPPEGLELVIPSQRILPDTALRGIVINIPEMRLYYFSRKNSHLNIETFPVGIGDDTFPTPTGSFVIGAKRKNPTWYIPPSLQAKYDAKTIPPGPDNPLGDYWVALKDTMYGIHGSDIPWSVGRLVTHGCIRMYPEDIAQFFNMVQPGTPVRLLYQPVKIAKVSDRILIEVHRDIYHTVKGTLINYAESEIAKKGLWQWVDKKKFSRAIKLQNGLLMDITAEGPPQMGYRPAE